MDFQILVVALQIVSEVARLPWLLMGVLRSRLAAEDAGRQEVLMAFLDGRKKVAMFSLAVHR